MDAAVPVSEHNLTLNQANYKREAASYPPQHSYKRALPKTAAASAAEPAVVSRQTARDACVLGAAVDCLKASAH